MLQARPSDLNLSPTSPLTFSIQNFRDESTLRAEATRDMFLISPTRPINASDTYTMRQFPAFADMKGPAVQLTGIRWPSQDSVFDHGIDAPERNQICWVGGSEWLCGQASSRALKNLIESAVVRCSKIGRDRYRRIIGKCHSKGLDIGQTMVADGMALAYRKYSKDYVAAEIAAKQNG